MAQVFLVAGMHRSGTSLVASMLERSGVAMGEALLPPNFGNPRGYFEDVEIVGLHDDMLAPSGQGALLRDHTLLPQPSDDDRRRAQSLIGSRSRHPRWGFKDPRATLYLDFWHELLPEARFVLLFRHPVDVVLSLRRRGSELEVLGEANAGFEAWRCYNASLLDFSLRHRPRCVLADIDRVAQAPGELAACLEERIDLTLDVVACNALVDSEALHHSSLGSEAAAWLQRLQPEVVSLYDELTRVADLPAQTPSGEGPNRRPLPPITPSGLPEERRMEASASLELLLSWLDPELAQHGLRELVRQIVRARERQELQEKELEERAERLLLVEEELNGRTEWAKDLSQQLDERNRRLLELDAELQERTGWAQDLSQQLDERNRRLLELDAELQERTGWAKELSRQLDERDRRLLELDAELQERTGWAKELSQQLDERDRRLLELQAELQERTDWAKELSQQLDERNRRLLELDAELQARTDWARALDAKAEELERRLTESGSPIAEGPSRR